jgi:hypothetical protein
VVPNPTYLLNVEVANVDVPVTVKLTILVVVANRFVVVTDPTIKLVGLKLPTDRLEKYPFVEVMLVPVALTKLNNPERLRFVPVAEVKLRVRIVEEEMVVVAKVEVP